MPTKYTNVLLLIRNAIKSDLFLREDLAFSGRCMDDPYYCMHMFLKSSPPKNYARSTMWPDVVRKSDYKTTQLDIMAR